MYLPTIPLSGVLIYEFSSFHWRWSTTYINHKVWYPFVISDLNFLTISYPLSRPLLDYCPSLQQATPHIRGIATQFSFHKRAIQNILCFIYSIEQKSLYYECCADSTSRLKSIIINKRKLNNKHSQRTQEFTWFGKLLTSTATTEKFHYKNREIQ